MFGLSVVIREDCDIDRQRSSLRIALPGKWPAPLGCDHSLTILFLTYDAADKRPPATGISGSSIGAPVYDDLVKSHDALCQCPIPSRLRTIRRTAPEYAQPPRVGQGDMVESVRWALMHPRLPRQGRLTLMEMMSGACYVYHSRRCRANASDKYSPARCIFCV